MSRLLRTLLIVTVLPLLALAPAQCQTPVNEQAIKDVADGKLKEAKASWWGFDPVEATRCLQAAIASGVPKLIVDNVGKPWIVDPIKLVSNQEIVFEAGVEVVAKKGSFQGGGDSLFTGSVLENVILRGDPTGPAVLRMHRSDYADAPYKKAEWRMVLNFGSCTHVRVSDLVLKESGGDGIYLGVGKDSLPNKDVIIRNVICDSNYRQGISVICAEDLLIEDCKLINTGGTPPQAGIDFEPNNTSERLVNCVMRNCVTESNRGCGYAIYIPTLDGKSLPASLRFEKCKSVRDAAYGTAIYTGNEPAKAVLGSIEFVDCSFERSEHAGIFVVNKPVAGLALRFERCSVLGTAVKMTEETPIMFMASGGASQQIGGIVFQDCVVQDYVERNPMSFLDTTNLARIGDITGRLTVRYQGAATDYPLTPELLNKWMPVIAFKDVPRVALKDLKLEPATPDSQVTEFGMAGVRTRGAAEYALYATAGQEVRLRAGYQQVGKYSGTTMPVVVSSPSGQEVAKASVPFQQEGEVAFTAPETGLYRVSVDPGGNYAHIVGSTHRLLVSGDGAAVHFYGPVGELFFWVPAGTKEFALRAYGEGSGEGVKATVCDPQGKVVEEKDNITRLHQFLITLPQPSTGEVFSVKLTRPSNVAIEDNYLLILGIPPLASSNKEALLKPAG